MGTVLKGVNYFFDVGTQANHYDLLKGPNHCLSLIVSDAFELIYR